MHTGLDVLHEVSDGAWLVVDLAPLADQTLVASAVLATPRLPATTGSALSVVVAYLKTRHLLLDSGQLRTRHRGGSRRRG